MEHELRSFSSFAEATEEAKRLAARYSADIRVCLKNGQWRVFGPVAAEDPLEWRRQLEIEALMARAEQSRRAQEIEDQDKPYEPPQDTYEGDPDHDEESYGWNAWYRQHVSDSNSNS